MGIGPCGIEDHTSDTLSDEPTQDNLCQVGCLRSLSANNKVNLSKGRPLEVKRLTVECLPYPQGMIRLRDALTQHFLVRCSAHHKAMHGNPTVPRTPARIRHPADFGRRP